MSDSPRNQPAPDRRGCAGFRRNGRGVRPSRPVCSALSACRSATCSDGRRVARTPVRGRSPRTRDRKVARPPRRSSVIQLHLGGGMPQQESFDPKPEAPVEYRGSFGVAKTKQRDVFSENFPKTAAIADKMTVVRSVVGRIPDHAQATYHLFTGYTPTAVIDYPQMGAVVSHELGVRGELPPYIAIPNNNSFAGGTGFLSSTFGPFRAGRRPWSGRLQGPRFFGSRRSVDRHAFDRRRAARQVVEKADPQAGSRPDHARHDGRFLEARLHAADLRRPSAAFTLDGETEETMQLYGRDVVGLREAGQQVPPEGTGGTPDPGPSAGRGRHALRHGELWRVGFSRRRA